MQTPYLSCFVRGYKRLEQVDFILHNSKVVGSNPVSATNVDKPFEVIQAVYFFA